MDIIHFLLTFLSIVLIVVFVLVVLMAFLIYKFAKKNPGLSIFLLILLLVIGTLEVVTVGGIVAGVATYVTAAISLMASYKKLKRGLKIK